MMMEELASRSELRKELGRERRRIRDRERRQSMSLEEKEKHLARRRRNYQLRRQRAETARLNPPPSPIQLPLSNALTRVSYASPPQFNAADAFVRSNDDQGPMLDIKSSHCLEIPVHKLGILPAKVLLNRIKHLARVLNDPAGDGVAVGEMMKKNGTSNCLTAKGLRLNCIKRLAWTISPAIQETLSESLQSITDG
ncbi:TRNA--methyltransferase isoform 1 [Hibiscus syriacus]|uniref:tRNA--methyltransferase isoform 1 n=1 Tax=Hibiscus syriacus TaxID=106335 RepID=A0A6A3C9P6_HIBSY|nr:TRNA--methyltransferase isoform 1 [Hibiscus syriacus]